CLYTVLLHFNNCSRQSLTGLRANLITNGIFLAQMFKHDISVATLVVVLITIGVVSGQGSGSCRTWCPRPDSTGQYDCCDHPHPGQCPSAHIDCPNLPAARILPTPCQDDGQCIFSEKCCINSCLGYMHCRRAGHF
ncbi:unnamed protein product, partial [Meganyctiphanes norvegica]